jgi:hypothetical protein
MIDLLFSAGQALSVIGLAYGAFLALTYREQANETRANHDRKIALLHHLTMA